MFASRRGEGSVRRPKRAAVAGVVTAVLALGVAAPVIGDGLNEHPSPAAELIASTSPATSAQVASARGLAPASVSAKKKRKKKRTVFRQVTMNSRITDQAIVTEEGKGTYVGIKCPAGSKAISGGVLSQYINLLVSSSAPNHPLTGKFTPNVWWLTVTNVNVDGQGGSLSWHGVVNCLTPVRLGSS